MKKPVKIFFSEKAALVTAVILGLGILYLLLQKIGLREVIRNFKDFPLIGFISVFSITTLSILITCEKWRLILGAYGYNIRFSKLLIFKLAGWAVSYLTPSLFIGGESVRAYMIKKEEKVPWSWALSSIIADKALEGTIGSFVILLGVVFLFFRKLLSGGLRIFLLVLVVFFLYILLRLFKNSKRGFASSLLHLFRLDKLKLFRKWQKGIDNFDQGLSSLFKSHKRIFFSGLFLSCLSCALTLLRYKTIIYFLDLEVSLYQIIIIYALTILVVVIPFIPGAFGTYESIQAFSFAILGLGSQAGVACIFIMRIIDLIMVGLGLIFLSYFGLMRLGKLYWIVWEINNTNKNEKFKEEKN